MWKFLKNLIREDIAREFASELGLGAREVHVIRVKNFPNRPNWLTQCCTQFKSFGKKCFVPGISLSFEYECYSIMQIQHTKNLNPGKFELGTTLS